RREMAGVPREQAEVVVHPQRQRELLDELGLERGATVSGAQVRGDRAGETDLRHVPEQPAEPVVALLANLLQERIHKGPRHRVQGANAGDEVAYRVEFAVSSGAAAARQDDNPDIRVNLVDGVPADPGAAVSPQTGELDLLPDEVLPVLRPGRDGHQP